MNLPSKIDLQVVCAGESNLSDIIARITVHAGSKNPYYIYFPKTNNDGRTSISADEFMEQFDSHYEIGLMDYNGSFETASQVVDIDIHYQNFLYPSLDIAYKRPLLEYEKHRWQSSKEMIAYYLSCQNDKYFADPQAVEIRPNELIRFKVRKNTEYCTCGLAIVSFVMEL
jgi:hypothetical protein